jgi:glutamate synthase domain-containing protein 1
VTTHLPLGLLFPVAAERGFDHVDPGDLAVAMCFLPTEPAARKRAEAIAERAAREAKLAVVGWREVPTCPEAPITRAFLVMRCAHVPAVRCDVQQTQMGSRTQ